MPTAAILTALPVEYAAVRAHLTDLKEVEHKGTIFEVGTFVDDGRTWQVVIAQVGAGNAPAAIVTERVIARFAPTVALFVGVAGGIKDVKLGDVVAATRVYGYESGKAGEQFRPRGDAGRSSYRMVQRALAVAGRTDWLSRIRQSVETTPAAVVAPIAAGEKVVADTASDTYRFIREKYDAAVAVEMEGRGFTEATYANDDLQALVVRGVSDLIDKKGEADAAGSQGVAASHAAAFALEVLATLTLPSTSGDPNPRPTPNSDSGTGSTPFRDYPIDNLIHRQNPHFVGRDALIAQIQELLNPAHSQVRPRRVAIHGLGGIGKTQIANEFARRQSGEYEVIWWIRANSPASLAADFAELGRTVGVVPPEATIEEALTATRRWLERGVARWLLIFDNAEDPDDLVDFMPDLNSGDVLITSRNPNWRRVADDIEVPVLPRDEAEEFLVRRVGRDPTSNPVETKALGDLADELDGLPLALEQAAAFIEETGCSFADYLDLFRNRKTELLAEGAPAEADYPSTVLTTWQLSIDRVRDIPGAAELLALFAFFGPESIPIETLVSFANLLPQPLSIVLSDELALQKALRALRRFSLVGIVDRKASIHRLVQAVVRDRLPDEARRGWSLTAVEIIASALPEDADHPQTWPQWEQLFPHAQAVERNCQDSSAAVQLIARINHLSGIYLGARGRPAEARLLIEKSLALGREALDSSDSSIAIGFHNLARNLKELSELEDALNAIKKALEIDKSSHGPEHVEVSLDLALMGSILREQGKHKEAGEILEQALTIQERLLGPNDRAVAITLNDLGSVYRRQGDYEAAKDSLTRALRIHELNPDGMDREIAVVLGNLGETLSGQGELKTAHKHLRRSLSMMDELYGPDHPMSAIAYLKFGRVLMKQGQIKPAKEYVQRALSIDESTYGGDHPSVAGDLDTLAGLIRDQGDTGEAKTLNERALRIRETAFGPDHPQVATSLNNIADILQVEGDLAGAQERFERAIRITEAAGGEKSRGFAVYNRNLANVLRQQGDLLGARQALQKALPIWRRIGDQERVAETLKFLRILDERIRARRTRN